jgi:hypothetical protein
MAGAALSQRKSLLGEGEEEQGGGLTGERMEPTWRSSARAAPRHWADVIEESLGGQRARSAAASEEKGDSFNAM